jgi:hypothetical protein
MGGGDEPPMDELKNWMYEKVEVNVAGNVLQSTLPELSQIDNDIFPEFNQFDDAAPYPPLPQSISQESANPYDWNNAQYGADLVSESLQFVNGVPGVIDQNFMLTSHHQPQTFIAAYPH